MRILLVAATAMELAPVRTKLGAPFSAPSPSAADPKGQTCSRLTPYSGCGHEIDVLLTGVGMVAAAAWCSRALSDQRYDLALNVGVCGSFDRALEPGTVVHVVSDRLAELGAEDGERFLSLAGLGLLEQEARPFDCEELVNTTPPHSSVLERLPEVCGITVNTVHGNARSIELATQRFRPQVESMEGAAFMYACMIHDLPFAQVRAVSNVVERRNRGAWRMADAITSLGDVTIGILETV